MKISSSYFGELEVPEDNVIMFKTSIPGFEDMHKYFIVQEEEEGEAMFCWLHSAEDVDVAFALLDVFKVMEDYRPEIDDEYLEELDYKEGDTISVLNIVNIPETISDMTVNLLAPIVINLSKMKGLQVILNNDAYELKHKIFDTLKKATEKSNGKEA